MGAPAGRQAILELPPLYQYQHDLVHSPSKRGVVVSAPQIGKTFSVAAWQVRHAWALPGRLSWWAAPTHDQTEFGFDALVQILEAVSDSQGRNAIASKGRSAPRRLVLRNGHRIDFRSWEREDNLGGAPVWTLVVDEAQELTRRAHSNLAARQAHTMGPSRYIGNADHVASEWWRICKAAEESGSYFQRWTWKDRIAYLAGAERQAYSEFLDGEREKGMEDFERLYEAKFLTLGTGVLNLRPACTLGGSAMEPVELPYFAAWDGKSECIAGLDLGEHVDYTVLSVVELETGRLLAMDRFRRVGGWAVQVARAMASCRRYCRTKKSALETGGGRIDSRTLSVYVDATMLGGPVAEMLEAAAENDPIDFVPVVFDQGKKAAMIRYLQAASVEGGLLKMPYIAEAVDEADMLERVPLARGVSYRGTQGSHDDVIWSLGLALYGVNHTVGAIL
jgi:hypothetical protein